MKTIVLIIGLIISIPGFGQTINQIGFYYVNGTNGLTSKNNYMVLSNGRIIDNSIPSSPTLVSQYSFTGDGLTVLIDGDYAFFGTGMSNDLFIADISNVSFPLHKSSLHFNIGNGVFGMDIKDSLLLVALGTGGVICSINVSDKSNPVMLDTLYISGGQCRDVVIKNNYAFAAHYGGLKIIDITNVSNLHLITSIGSGYNSIDISDSLAFLGKSSGGIDVFNISDPLNPSPAFSIPNSGGTAWDLKYHQNYLYLATDFSGLFIYKINANSGTEMANFHDTENGQSFGVCLQDSLILLPGLINGVAILQYDSTSAGITPASVETQIKFFPNPTKDFITLDQGNLVIYKTEIIDLKRNVIKQEEYNRSTGLIDVSDFPTGLYLIRIITIDRVITKKFIKSL